MVRLTKLLMVRLSWCHFTNLF